MMTVTCLGMVRGDAIAQERGERERGELVDSVRRERPERGERGGGRERRPQFGGQGGFMRMLPIMVALDADGNGEISTVEIKGAASALQKLDKNKDGKLTQEELRPSFGGNRGRISRSGTANRPHVLANEPARPEPPIVRKIGDLSPQDVIAQFGARGRNGVADRELENYRRLFGFTDADRDGRHSKQEYIDGGAYLTREARQGIFRAADSNNDGFVSEAEYVENRIITDEAKEIFSDLDANGNNRLTAEELVASGKLKDQKLANEVFKALDTNGDGELIIPEYLRVWGRWARL